MLSLRIHHAVKKHGVIAVDDPSGFFHGGTVIDSFGHQILQEQLQTGKLKIYCNGFINDRIATDLIDHRIGFGTERSCRSVPGLDQIASSRALGFGAEQTGNEDEIGRSQVLCTWWFVLSRSE
jgi:hypothetical protein